MTVNNNSTENRHNKWKFIEHKHIRRYYCPDIQL